jgi:glycosyltransferase involved in cell wall biosynthesis
MSFRVLHIVPSVPFGGLQRIAALLAAEQRRSGLDVHVLGLYSGAELQELLARYEVPHTFLGGSRPRLSTIRRYWSVLRRGWSIVHIHGGLLWSNTVALIAKRSLVVYHAHNYPTEVHSLKSWVLKRINRSLVDVIIAVSQDVANTWRSAGIGRSVDCVYNAIEVPHAAKPVRPRQAIQSPVFGMTTRLAKDKGVFEFLDVAEVIHARRRDARFIIAGEGPERHQLENEVARRGLSSVFQFPGYLRDLDAFWSGVDVALFTAPKEPFGLRVLEPMVRGIPVVAYLTGAGSDEIFSPGTTASVAHYGDVRAITEKALALCDDAGLYQQISDAAFRDVTARFSILAMADSVNRVYQSHSKSSLYGKFRS